MFRKTALVEEPLASSKKDSSKQKQPLEYPTFYRQEAGCESYTAANMSHFLWKRKDDPKWRIKGWEGRAQSHREQDWVPVKEMETCTWLGFQNCYGTLPVMCLLFLPFEQKCLLQLLRLHNIVVYCVCVADSLIIFFSQIFRSRRATPKEPQLHLDLI